MSEMTITIPLCAPCWVKTLLLWSISLGSVVFPLQWTLWVFSLQIDWPNRSNTLDHINVWAAFLRLDQSGASMNWQHLYPVELDDNNNTTTYETNCDQLLVLFHYPNPSRPCVICPTQSHCKHPNLFGTANFGQTTFKGSSLSIFGHFMLPGHMDVDAALGADAALGWLVWLGCQRWLVWLGCQRWLVWLGCQRWLVWLGCQRWLVRWLVWWWRVRWRRRNSAVSWCGRYRGYRRRWFWGHAASLHGVVLLLGICSATIDY